MQKELIDKANEIIKLIERNERAVEELSNYTECGKTLYTECDKYLSYNISSQPIEFEDWEIRLMIHQKKQRINALKMQLERL